MMITTVKKSVREKKLQKRLRRDAGRAIEDL